jgi:hypothetical protein
MPTTDSVDLSVAGQFVAGRAYRCQCVSQTPAMPTTDSVDLSVAGQFVAGRAYRCQCVS